MNEAPVNDIDAVCDYFNAAAENARPVVVVTGAALDQESGMFAMNIQFGIPAKAHIRSEHCYDSAEEAFDMARIVAKDIQRKCERQEETLVTRFVAWLKGLVGR